MEDGFKELTQRTGKAAVCLRLWENEDWNRFKGMLTSLTPSNLSSFLLFSMRPIDRSSTIAMSSIGWFAWSPQAAPWPWKWNIHYLSLTDLSRNLTLTEKQKALLAVYVWESAVSFLTLLCLVRLKGTEVFAIVWSIFRATRQRPVAVILGMSSLLIFLCPPYML